MASTKGTIGICEQCKRMMKLCSRGLCNTCYTKMIRTHKNCRCNGCGKTKPHHSHGMCKNCYEKYMYNINKKRRNEKQRERYWKRHDQYLAGIRKRNSTQKYKENGKAHRRKYRINHINFVRGLEKDWHSKHPETASHYAERYKTRKANLPCDLTNEQWNDILESHHHSCHYCGASGVKLVREHKIPVIRGGGYTAENIVPACVPCNSSKGTMTDVEFFEFVKKFPR